MLIVRKLQKEILSKYASHGVQTKTSSCNVTNVEEQNQSMITLERFAEPTDDPFDSGEEELGIPKRETETGPKHGKNKSGKGTDLDTKAEKWAKH